MKFSLEIKILIAVVMIYVGTIGTCNAGMKTITLEWDAVPCSDIGGYAIYRNLEPDNWDNLNNAESAYKQIPATGMPSVTFSRPVDNVWYYTVRAFDTSGNYSTGASMVCMVCPFGDLDCDGDVDGTDLKFFSEAFGR